MKLFVDNLTNSDFSYLHPSRGMLGETWLSHIELEGELDEQGMICDFGIVKATVRNLLDDLIDHRLLIPTTSASATSNQFIDGKQVSVWTLENGDQIFHAAPESAVTLIDVDNITPAAVATWCETIVKEQLPATVKAVRIRFTTENINGAFYHYSHGLKKHNGKCQRIAHGHRSKIEITKNSNRDSALEAQWADTLKDSYIATESDRVDALSPLFLENNAQTSSKNEINQPHSKNYHFSYQSPEGQFELSLPKYNCYLIEQDTTVENITHHIAKNLKDNHPSDSISVKGFEGLSKGAIVSF